jgi:hypothetical protein
LSTVCASRTSSCQSRCSQGGKRRRERRFDVSLQRRLVIFDGDEVSALPRDNRRAHVFLGERGIPRDQPAFQRDEAEQLQGRLVLVGRALDR